jgi:hypothetical protein
MSLMKRGLSRCRGFGAKTQGELKVQAKATMFMKTKERHSRDLVKATMLMKTKDL